MPPLVETLVADVPSGVEIVLVAADLHDSLVFVQGHDQAAVAAAKKAGCNLLLHKSSSSPSMVRSASRRLIVSDMENFEYRIIADGEVTSTAINHSLMAHQGTPPSMRM
jgi:hypothetical protein